MIVTFKITEIDSHCTIQMFYFLNFSLYVKMLKIHTREKTFSNFSLVLVETINNKERE